MAPCRIPAASYMQGHLIRPVIMHENTIQELFHRYLQGTATPEEEQLLKNLLRENRDDEQLSALLKEEWEQLTEADPRFANYDVASSWRQIVEPQGRKPARIRTLRRWGWAAAAAVLLALAGSAYLFRQSPTLPPPVITAHKNDVPPGSSKATLVLGDGSVVSLDSAGNRLISQGHTAIRQTGGQLQYEGDGNAAEVTYNTLTTPNGGQFKVTLPDGTQVWLNAASSIRYPTVFTGEKRVVEITGEVYMEVARRLQKGGRSAGPFVVKVHTASGNSSEIEVLGTHFNINAYNDEPAVKTTLLEGSVKVTSGSGRTSVLKPGQQSQINSGGAIHIVEQVNTGAVIAWKQGYFSFAQTDLRTVMRQIGRWYDVEILYEGNVPQKKFGGAIPRDNNASEVLKILELSGVHFRIEGRKIIVTP